jgi:hypothetical protein
MRIYLRSQKTRGVYPPNRVLISRSIGASDRRACWNLDLACISIMAEHLGVQPLNLQWNHSLLPIFQYVPLKKLGRHVNPEHIVIMGKMINEWGCTDPAKPLWSYPACWDRPRRKWFLQKWYPEKFDSCITKTKGSERLASTVFPQRGPSFYCWTLHSGRIPSYIGILYHL